MKYLSVMTGRFVIGALALSLSIPAFAASVQHKPQPPIQVTIRPAQTNVTADTIKPGDVVEFKVVATSMVDAAEMHIQVTLADGAELVSGDLWWTGPAMKNEVKTLVVTVKAPQKGIGSVKAQLSITLSGGNAFSTSSEYTLGGVKQAKPEPARPVRKDSKGRGVVEYR